MSDAGQQAGGSQQTGGDGGQQQQQQQQAGGAGKWFDGFDDATKGYIQNRGLVDKTPQEAFLNVAKAHQEAASKLGVPPDQIVRWPTKSRAEDPQAWADIDTRLGAGSKPEDYNFDGLGVEDNDFLETVRGFAAEHKLPKETARALAKELAEGVAEERDAETKAHQASAQVALSELKKEWGFNYNANVAVAKATAEKLGIKPEAIQEWEKSAGTIAVMEAMLKIGSAIGEDKFVTSPVTGNVMSREQAVARKAELMKDADFAQRLAKQDATAWKEMTDLNRIITVGMGPPPGFRG